MGLGNWIRESFKLLLLIILRRILERISPEPEAKPESSIPKYTSAYQKEYVRDFLSNGFGSYRNLSPYIRDLDSLYSSNGLLYDGGRFKYRKQ